MLIKIVENPADGTPPGSVITQAQIQKLSFNMCNKLQVADNGIYRDIDYSDGTNPHKNDTKTAYFTKESIYELFAQNDPSDGLLIYFGVHDSNTFPVRQPSYNNKLMAMLVTTSGATLNMDVNHFIQVAGAPLDGSGGDGMDNGKLCPPDTTCGG